MHARTSPQVPPVWRVSMLLVLALTLGLSPACSGDESPTRDTGPVADQAPRADVAPRADAPAPDTAAGVCTDGDKRCDGLFRIERCDKGVWVAFEDCSQKKLGGQSCTCSMTLLYVCAAGGNVCP